MTRTAFGRLAGAAGLLLMCVVAVVYARRVPVTIPSSAPRTAFSAEEAMEHVAGLASAPRPLGSPANAVARQYILDELRVLGLQPQVQATLGIGTRYAEVGPVTNVVARLPGTQPGGKAVLLMAHYDGVAAGPAAGDDASGCAVLLETLRALRAGPPLLHDVIVLFTDGEEAALLGAAAFAREHPWRGDVAVVLNFEARGDRGPSFMFETGPGNLDVVRLLRDVRGVRATSLSVVVYRTLPNDTDLSELSVLGQPAMNFAFIGGVNRYHTAQDDYAHLDPRSVQHEGVQAVALTRALANGPLPRPHTGDAVFFDLPLLGLVAYPEGAALPIVVAAVVIGVLALVVTRRRQGARFSGLLIAAGATLVCTLLATVLAVAVATALQRTHAALASGTPEWSGIYAAGIAFLALAIVAFSRGIIGRWSNAVEASLGALVVWSVLAVLVTLLLPGVSYLFSWPMLLMAIVLVVRARWPGSIAGHLVTWAGVLFLVMLVVPTVDVMACSALGVTGAGGALIGLFAALAAWLAMPLVDDIIRGRERVTAFACGAIFLVLTGIGLLTVRTDSDHPTAASLVYGLDADSSRAWMTGIAWSASARTVTSRVVGELFDSASGSPPSTPPAWLRRRGNVGRAVSAPVVDLTPPSATIVSDSVVAGERRIRLRVLPGSARSALLLTADNGTVLRAAIDGRSIATDRYRSRAARWALQYDVPADTGFLIELATPTGAGPLVLGLTGRSVGLPFTLPIRLPRRPAGIIPMQTGDAYYVHREVRFGM